MRDWTGAEHVGQIESAGQTNQPNRPAQGHFPALAPVSACRLHCLTFMKSPIILVAALALLVAGCATSEKGKEAANKTTYHKPLNSPGAKFGSLPPIVQRTVLAEAGQGEVVDAKRDISSGRVVYKIYFRDPEIYPTLYVAPDGSVLNPDLTVAVKAREGVQVKMADVPAKVKDAIPKRAPITEVSYVTKEAWGPLVVFVVNFKDEAHYPKLFLSEDGTSLDETQ